jgi:hypothetical protein
LPFMDWALKEFRNQNFPGKTNCAKKGMTMCKEKKGLTKEAKIEKAEVLMEQLSELELSVDELAGIAGGPIKVIRNRFLRVC